MLNDLDISSSHLERLMADLSGAQAITQHFIDEEQPLVKGYLTTFASVATKLRSTLRVCYFHSCSALGLSLPGRSGTTVQSIDTAQIANSHSRCL